MVKLRYGVREEQSMKVCASILVKLARCSHEYRNSQGPDRQTSGVPIDFERHGEEVLG